MEIKAKSCILVVGPESSGTRWLAETIAQHPIFADSKPLSGHKDPLDYFWDGGSARSFLEMGIGANHVVTRRSLPSAKTSDSSATYMEFDDFGRLQDLCVNSGFNLHVLICVRSPEANISSWYTSRSSALGDRKKAEEQYKAAYKHLISWLSMDGAPPFWFYSYEAVLLEGKTYISSLFRLLDLPPFDVSSNGDITANLRRYIFEAEQLNYTFTLDEPIELTENAKGLICTAGGWAPAEPTHSWTLGEAAELSVPLTLTANRSSKDIPLRLCISLKPFLYSEILKCQHLTLLVNSEIVYSGSISAPTDLEVLVTSKCLYRRNPVKLRFVTPNSVIPATLDASSGEQKCIALAISKLVFKSAN